MKKKTLDYEWELGRERIVLEVNSYVTTGGLQIEMMHEQEDRLEPFASLTVNVGAPGRLQANEAYITDMCGTDKMKFIEKYRLGRVLPETVSSGFAVYHKAAFDMERLSELDPEGVERYRKQHPELYLEESGGKKKTQMERQEAEMEKKPILDFEWEQGKEKIQLNVESSMYGSLYIGMDAQQPEGMEYFDDLTVNLPYAPHKANVAYIDPNCSEEKIRFIQKYGLGKVLGEMAYSRYCTFKKVAFDMERLREMDPRGVDSFLRMHPELQKRKKQKSTEKKMER